MMSKTLMSKAANQPRLVIVEWEDAYSRSAWMEDSDVEKDFDDGGYDCVTVGYLIRESKTRIILAACASFTNGPTWGLLKRIPRGMVRSIKDLK